MLLLERISQWFHINADDKDQLIQQQFNEQLANLLLFAWFVEARDPYTGGHLWRVSRFSYLLAEAAQLPEFEVVRISIGGFLHDLGKIGIPDAILRKADKLTDEEYDIIKTHPDIGLRLLAANPLAQMVKVSISQHHERPDGRGYPLGLTNEEILLEARIVGISDAFDAMTSSRSYRKGMSIQAALDIVEEAAGSQFDSGLAKLFIQLGENGVLDHIVGHSDQGIPLQSCPMCGPTLTLRRDQQAGELIYCRNCGGEFSMVKRDNCLIAQPTGKTGTAQQLEPAIDETLIAETVASVVKAMPVRDLMKQYRPHANA